MGAKEQPDSYPRWLWERVANRLLVRSPYHCFVYFYFHIFCRDDRPFCEVALGRHSALIVLIEFTSQESLNNVHACRRGMRVVMMAYLMAPIISFRISTEQ